MYELKLDAGQVHPLQCATNSRNAFCVCDLTTEDCTFLLYLGRADRSPKCSLSISLLVLAAGSLGPSKKFCSASTVCGKQSTIVGSESFSCNDMGRKSPRDHEICFPFSVPASPISIPLIVLIIGRSVVQQFFWQELTFTHITDD